MKTERVLLGAGLAMPAIYLLTLVAAASVTPGYRLGADPPSVLGQAGAPLAVMFNLGLVATAIAGAMAAAGLAMGLRRLRVHPALVVLVVVTALLPPLSLGVAGLLPLPHPLHQAFNVALAGLLTPLAGALAMLGLRRGRTGALLLGGAFVLDLALVAGLAGGLATPDTVIFWILGVGAVFFATVAYLSWTVGARARR